MRIFGVDPGSTDVLRAAVKALLEGRLVAFPTDTYYALGAVATNVEAVARVFAAKGRSAVDPLPVLVADRDQWRAATDMLPSAALRLADRFWPGPLTIVSRRAPYLPLVLTAGGETIGVRQPRAPLAIALCHTIGAPLVGTSANTHGRPAPVTAVEVALDLGEAVDVILDGGECPVARPSTVVDVTQTPPAVVRAGAIGADVLREFFGDLCAAGA